MVVMLPALMHVMSFDVVVMSFDAMWCDCLCHGENDGTLGMVPLIIGPITPYIVGVYWDL